MPKAMVAAQSRSESAASLGDIAGWVIEREVEDLQAEVMRDADLVDRGATGGKVFHHLCVTEEG